MSWIRRHDLALFSSQPFFRVQDLHCGELQRVLRHRRAAEEPCRYVCTYVCMYWCIYIYIYVCIDACICICIYVRTYVVGQSMAWHFKKITFNLSQSLGDRIKLTLLLLRSQGSVYQNQFCTQEPILRIYIQLHCQRCLKLQRQCCKNSQRQRSKILQRHE
jgi:hypothetical protein